MAVSRKSCRLCLLETEFNVSLFGSYCRKINMIDKINVCLSISIEKADYLNTICYKCADSIERYYEFIIFVKKSQTKFDNYDRHRGSRERSILEDSSPNKQNRRHVTSYIRQQVFDADYTFSFLEIPNEEERKENKVSSPFFSYFSPPNVLKQTENECSVWKTPRRVPCDDVRSMCMLNTDREHYKRAKCSERPQQHSRDLFESQSQDVDEAANTMNWNLTPDDDILKKVREKCFGRSEF